MAFHQKRPLWLFISFIATVTLLTSCETAANVIRQTRTVRAGQAQEADVRIVMGAGKLMVEGGARTLMEGEFETSYAEWDPEITYTIDGHVGDLSIEQPPMRGGIRTENIANEWAIRLNDEIPMDLSIELGAGQSEVDLTGMSLTDLDIRVGAAEITLDLRGNWNKDLKVRMEGGVGKLLILLPSRVGVRAEVRGGIGAIETLGLEQKGSRWYNDAYDESDVVLDLDVEGGIGEIRLEVEGY